MVRLRQSDLTSHLTSAVTGSITRCNTDHPKSNGTISVGTRVMKSINPHKPVSTGYS